MGKVRIHVGILSEYSIKLFVEFKEKSCIFAIKNIFTLTTVNTQLIRLCLTVCIVDRIIKLKVNLLKGLSHEIVEA